MSSKHTRSKQDRSHGAYRRRLNRRGINSPPTMATLESLRRRQGATPEEADRGA